MNEDLIKILLIEDNPGDVRLLQEVFAETKGCEFEVTTVDRLNSALKQLEAEWFDLILLDLGLPDSQGFDTFAQVHRQAPDIAIIVLTITADETLAMAAVKAGAQDYLIKGQIDNYLLVRAIRYAIERQRRLLERERELRSLERLSGLPQATVTAQTFGLRPLRESLPATFIELVQQYSRLLDLSLEQHLYKVNHHISEGLQTMSEQLGFLKAGPRDVVDIHITALKRLTQDAAPLKAQAFTEEGRLQALELMGYLTSFYLNYSLVVRKPPWPATTTPTPHDKTAQEDHGG